MLGLRAQSRITPLLLAILVTTSSSCWCGDMRKTLLECDSSSPLAGVPSTRKWDVTEATSLIMVVGNRQWCTVRRGPSSNEIDHAIPAVFRWYTGLHRPSMRDPSLCGTRAMAGASSHWEGMGCSRYGTLRDLAAVPQNPSKPPNWTRHPSVHLSAPRTATALQGTPLATASLSHRSTRR